MAEVTDNYVRRFRRAVGDSTTPPKFEISVIQDMFDEAAEQYPDDSLNVHLCYAVINALNQLWQESIPLVSYTANASSESLSDMGLRYERALAMWQKRLEEAIALGVKDDVAISWGSSRRTPLRDEEYPDDFAHWSN